MSIINVHTRYGGEPIRIENDASNLDDLGRRLIIDRFIIGALDHNTRILIPAHAITAITDNEN